MKRFTVTDLKTKKVFDYDTVEEYAAAEGIEPEYVHTFLRKNKFNHLTFNNQKVIDNGDAIEEERQKTREEKIRQQAYLEAKADLAAMTAAAESIAESKPKAKAAPKSKPIVEGKDV